MSPTPVAFRRPKLQQQLVDSDPYGYAGCTAYASATVGDADTRGVLVYTGKQIRAASDEPVPDNESPGLNLLQVDVSLYRLSHGAIDLDTRYRESTATVQKELVAGKWAILQIHRGTLHDRGYGRNKFRGGHAVTIGYDQVMKVPILGDPLESAWEVARWEDLWAAAANLVIGYSEGHAVRCGKGKTYVALSRDVYSAPNTPPPDPIRYSVRFTPGSFFVYDVNSKLHITGRKKNKGFTKATSARAGAPRRYPWPQEDSSRRLMQITEGSLAGAYVEPGAAHVFEVKA